MSVHSNHPRLLLVVFRSFLLLVGFLLTNWNLLAQNEHQKWFFGHQAGLDFASGSPVAINGSVIQTDEGCSSICDGAGNLLFYTDGVTVFNRTHNVMPNGQGLFGSISTSQSALIVKSPGLDSVYLLFTAAAQVSGSYKGLSYSIVDMRLNNGLGDVAQKNILLCDSITEKLTAIRASNGRDVWLVVHRWNSDAFYAYEVSCPVANLPTVRGPVISRVGAVPGQDGAPSLRATSQGCMKISPDGRKLALAWGRYRDNTTGISDATMEWFDFDNATGIVSSPHRLDIPGLRGYGCAFSPSSRYLYISYYGLVQGARYGDIRQYDLQAANVAASEVTIYSGFPECATMQLGPDQKLYIARLQLNGFISVIANPDAPGASCGFANNGVNLGTGKSTFGLPNHWDRFVPQPIIWTFQDTSICSSESLAISANVADAYGWLWSNGATAATTQIAGPSVVTVEVYVGCDTLRDTFQLLTHECDPHFLPGPNAEVCQDDGLKLDATQHGAMGYHWTYGESTPEIQTADTGWIWVDVYFANDTLRDSIHVTHRDCNCVLAANVFTPNGDGANDVFRPTVQCALQSYRLSLFDRWGALLFQTNADDASWDGKFRGTPVPESVYYYLIDWKQDAGTSHREVGNVLITR